MGGTRVKKPNTCLLRFHLSIFFSDVVGPVECWADARLISATSIHLAGRPISSFGLEALHAITSSSNSEVAAEATLRSFFVRSRSIVSGSCSAEDTGCAAMTHDRSSWRCSNNSNNKAADVWATIEVDVRSNAHVGTNPARRPAWHLLLSRLVTYSRDKAFAMPRPSKLSAALDGFFTESLSCSKVSKGLELPSLEDVYSSLKPKDPWRSVRDKGHGMDERCQGLGPGPGARGLNALPVAVVMRVAQYLPASGLDALSGTCRDHQETCSSIVPGLKLDLFPHQAEGLRWMRDRERRRDPHPHREFVEIFPPRPADHGVAEGVVETSKGEALSGRLWLNVVDGVVRAEAPESCRPVRGGMLCDEPGLGKTITVLALLLRTRGILPATGAFFDTTGEVTLGKGSSRSGSGEVTPEQWRHWGEMERQMAMIKVVRALQREDPAGIFSRTLDPDTLRELGMPDYLDIVGDPIDLQTIARRASAGPREASIKPYQDFEEFASDIRRVFSNAVLYHGCDQTASTWRRVRAIPAIAEAAHRLWGGVEGLLKSVFAGRRVDRGEVLAQRLRSLKPSSATLIVVPPPMLPHWRNQLTLHAQPGRLGPLFFDDRSDQPLPLADELQGFGVVVTTYQRLTNEQPRWATSPLARVYWLRMVLDEGHAMGTSALTSCGDVARRVEAERRWVMTGTPTPTTSADAALRNLSNLMHFLREKELAPDWRRNIRGPFMANRPEGRERLRRLLSEMMIRHTKEDVLAIPPPLRESVVLPMSQQEALSYDTIVSFVRSNLLLTSMEGKTSGWQDSLLNPANTKYAMEALTNIRLSCCGGGSLIPVVKRHHHLETLEMLQDLHAVSKIDVQRVDNFINRATMGEISSCQVCVDCVDVVNNACRVCGDPYDVDDFQRIQPGFELRWMYNIREQERLHQQRKAAARLQRQGSAQSQKTSPQPNHASPERRGGLGSASGAGDRSGLSPPGGGSPLSPGDDNGGLLEDEEGEELVMHSKAFYAIGRLKTIRQGPDDDRRRSDWRQVKAIIFSQFLPVLNIVGDKFLREFGGYPSKGWHERGEKCVAEFWGKNRANELERFRTDPDCFVLLLSKKGAHGLDLSFVTHMFLMEQIWDRSLETQVVARANRMGAKGSVTVVQLIMKDTMEEELRSYVSSNPDRVNSSSNSSRSGNLQEEQHSKSARQKSPWEISGKRSRRSVGGGAGGGRRIAGRGFSRSVPSSASPPSVQQEHAKVHFLLTSLRSSRSRRGAEDEEVDVNKGIVDGGKGKGKRKGEGCGSRGSGNVGKAVRRGVTFGGVEEEGDDCTGGGGSSKNKRRRVAFAVDDDGEGDNSE